MKKLLLITSFLVSFNVYANDACVEREEVIETKDINTPTPESLKDATIIVRQKDGTTKEIPANEFKVVPRKQQFITKVRSTLDCSKAKPSKNRISLVGGYGPSGNIDKSVTANTAKIETEFRPNVGLQYQRLITDRFSLGLQGLSNKSLDLLIGFDF